MTEKPQVDFEEVVKSSGMPVTEEAVRTRFNAIAAEEGLITNTSRMSPFWRLITHCDRACDVAERCAGFGGHGQYVCGHSGWADAASAGLGGECHG